VLARRERGTGTVAAPRPLAMKRQSRTSGRSQPRLLAHGDVLRHESDRHQGCRWEPDDPEGRLGSPRPGFISSTTAADNTGERGAGSNPTWRRERRTTRPAGPPRSPTSRTQRLSLRAAGCPSAGSARPKRCPSRIQPARGFDAADWNRVELVEPPRERCPRSCLLPTFVVGLPPEPNPRHVAPQRTSCDD
jgi:hypothetical protein